MNHQKESNNLIESLNEELNKSNTLLIIDNLETFENDEIRELIGELNCKILITSRIGLGEIEKRYFLEGLKPNEASKYFKALANIKNNKLLLSFSNKVDGWVKELNFNPLSIKWFVEAVEDGLTPREVMNNKSKLEDFCLSNIYNKLNDEAKILLQYILVYYKPINHDELCYFSGLESYKVNNGLISLVSSAFVTRLNSKKLELETVLYSISELVKNYLSSNHNPDKTFVENLFKAKRLLSENMANQEILSDYNEFQIDIFTDIVNHPIAGKYLSDALDFSYIAKNRDDIELFKKAITKVDQAKNIDSNYVEVYRVAGLIYAAAEDYSNALQKYEKGLEIDGDSPNLLYYYCGFLLKSGDYDKALEISTKLYKLRNLQLPVITQYIECLLRKKLYDNAFKIIEEDVKILNNTTEKNKRAFYKPAYN